MNNFSNILKYLRQRAGMTQLELADKLKVSKSTISMYENGNREPDFETLEFIADIFNVDMNFLIGKTSSSQPSYYDNPDAREMAQFLYDNPEYKVLFDASRKVKKEDIDFVKQMIDRVRGADNDTGC